MVSNLVIFIDFVGVRFSSVFLLYDSYLFFGYCNLSICFLNKDKVCMGEEVRGNGRSKTVIRMYYMKKSISKDIKYVVLS